MMNITSISIPRKDLVFAKTFDNSLRQVAKQGSGFEGCLEHSKVSERWSDITDAFANEKAEAEARAAEMTKNSDEAEQEDVVTAELNKIRSAPTTFAENGPSYWKSVANRTVRTYVTLLPEGKTLQGMSSCISQVSWLKKSEHRGGVRLGHDLPRPRPPRGNSRTFAAEKPSQEVQRPGEASAEVGPRRHAWQGGTDEDTGKQVCSISIISIFDHFTINCQAITT